MCLITEQELPKMAEEDIVVYKKVKPLGNNTFSGIIYSFDYRLDILHTTEMEESDEYAPFDRIAASKYFSKENLTCIALGFHSARRHGRLSPIPESDSPIRVIVQCTIPAGSMYYEDTTGLLVSNQIIINKVVPQVESPAN